MTHDRLKAQRSMITDDELQRVHGNANFGDTPPRTVVSEGVWKVACGYHCGSTMYRILREHGLTLKSRGRAAPRLSAKGRRYLGHCSTYVK